MKKENNANIHPRASYYRRRSLNAIRCLLAIVATVTCVLIVFFIAPKSANNGISNVFAIERAYTDISHFETNEINIDAIAPTEQHVNNEFTKASDDVSSTASETIEETIPTLDEFDNKLAELNCVEETIPETTLEDIPEEVMSPVSEKIELNTDKVKKNYFVGSKLNTKNLLVELVFDDGHKESVDLNECVISDVSMKSVGTKTVKVSYHDFSANYEIHVKHNINDVKAHTMYATTDLNLRSGPGTEYSKKTTVGMNTKLVVVGEVVDSVWVVVKYGDDEYFCSSKYLAKDKIIVDTNKKSKTDSKSDNKSYGNFIKGEKGASSDVVYAANKYWTNNVPKWLRNKFKNNGWKIIVSGKPLNKRYGYSSSIAGMTDTGAKTIYLDNRKSVIERALIHELGHFVDCINGWPSQSSEFQKIYKSEKSKFTDPRDVGDGHAKSNGYEYFAEVFNTSSKKSPTSTSLARKW